MSITPTEAYLTNLAKDTFLSMWSFPNPGYGQPTMEKGGKELCDLLVVFEDKVILFSDKSCEYPQHSDPRVAWKRWYRRSIAASVKQLFGAKKTIEQFPERVFWKIHYRRLFQLYFQSLLNAVFSLLRSRTNRKLCANNIITALV
jgi:hypothetical protein